MKQESRELWNMLDENQYLESSSRFRHILELAREMLPNMKSGT